MDTKPEFATYLECERNKLIAEFPKLKETTTDLFQKVYEFLSIDFEDLSDDRVFRCFLSSFKEIICFAVEADVSKKYLRYFFKSLNNEIVVGYLVNYAKSRAKDIRFVMDSFLGYFVATWQGYNDDKKRVLEEIVHFIDYQM